MRSFWFFTSAGWVSAVAGRCGTRLEALMKGRGFRSLQSSALAFGAVLAFASLAGAADTPKQVTFSKDVAPIFQAKCQECHQPNSIAPMSLITYQEARPCARSTKERVATRQMPPGPIDKTVAVQHF